MKKHVTASGLIALCLALSCFSLVGCGGQSVSSSSSESSSSIAEETFFEIGSTDLPGSLIVTNTTGTAVTEVALKPAAAEAYGAALLNGGATWDNGIKARIHYASEGADDILNIQITLADGTVHEMHNVAASTLADANLMLTDGITYLSYHKDGTAISTLADEQAIIAAAAEAAAAEAAAAEAAAASPAETYTDYSSGYAPAQESGGYSAYEAPAAAASPAPAQSGDSCVGGGVVLR